MVGIVLEVECPNRRASQVIPTPHLHEIERLGREDTGIRPIAVSANVGSIAQQASPLKLRWGCVKIDRSDPSLLLARARRIFCRCGQYKLRSNAEAFRGITRIKQVGEEDIEVAKTRRCRVNSGGRAIKR